MRYSLRELLIVGTVASLAVPALVYANPTAGWLIAAATGVWLMAALIRVVVGRGPVRAKAIGLAMPAGLYAAVCVVGVLPGVGTSITTFFPTHTLQRESLRWVQARRSYWIDDTGRRLPGNILSNPPPSAAGEIALPDWLGYHLTYHSLAALLFGYAGQKYAGRVYRQQAGGPAPETSNPN